MIEKDLFYKIADTNFKTFEVAEEKDITEIYRLYPRKDMIRDIIKKKITQKDVPIELPEKITIEVYIQLVDFCIKNNIEELEACALFKIISDVLAVFRNNSTKKEVYEQFKKSILTFSMNRFSSQIGILKKETVYSFTDFFVDVIYKRYSLIHYCLTNKDFVSLETKKMTSYTLPDVDDLSKATEAIPRNVKILKQYFESTRPKTELEQKIEMVLEFEKERLDKKMETIFEEQDKEFNSKVDELLNKKKK